MVNYCIQPEEDAFLVRALSACSHLQELRLEGLNWGAGEALAAALEEGCAPGLRALTFGWYRDVGEGGAPLVHLVTALKAFPRPALALSVHGSMLTWEAMELLLLAFAKCPQLQELRLDYLGAQGGQSEALAEALGQGWCPGLQRLHLKWLWGNAPRGRGGGGRGKGPAVFPPAQAPGPVPRRAGLGRRR
jgi:hypothetical protein